MRGYLYLNLYTIITIASVMVTAFAIIIGSEPIRTPYTSQQTRPVANIMNIHSEISLVCFVVTTLITCGTKDMVVSVPAIEPISEI